MQLAGTRLQHHPSRAGLTKQSKAGPVWTGEVRFNEQWLDQPLRWSRPRRVFVCAHGDLFHEGAPDEWIDRAFAVMALAPQHTFQVLTKRPARMRAYLTSPSAYGRILAAAAPLRRARPQLGDIGIGNPATSPMRWVWLGTSVEDQARANQRVPILLDTPAAVRWISAEPLLGPVDLTNLDPTGIHRRMQTHGWSAIWKGNPIGRPWLDWVVIGGESGREARMFDIRWGRDLISQCRAANVPVFMKQMGTWPMAMKDKGAGPEPWPLALDSRKGTDMAEWPEDLRIQEYPAP